MKGPLVIMKNSILFFILFFSLTTFAEWKQNTELAKLLNLPRAVTSSAVRIDGAAPIELNVGIVPSSCYIREDSKASQDFLFLYYKIDDYKQQFDPNKITVSVDNIPLTHAYANNIKSFYIKDNIITTVGANYAMNAPFSTLFKKGAVLTIEDNKTQTVIAEIKLKNSYRSYVNADTHCRKNIYNTYFLSKPNDLSKIPPKLYPMPQNLAEKYKVNQAKRNNKMWKLVSDGQAGQYINSNIFAIVNGPTQTHYTKSFYTCLESVQIVLFIPLNDSDNITYYSKLAIKSLSTKEIYNLDYEYLNYIEGNGTYMYFNLFSSVYEKLKPNEQYVITTQSNPGKYLSASKYKFTLSNLPDTLNVLGKSCAQEATKYNLQAIQSNLRSFPSSVPHPDLKTQYNNLYTVEKVGMLQYWMRRYGLSNTEAYQALGRIDSFNSRFYDCQAVSWDDARSMSEYELENQIECNKNIAQEAAQHGYASAFNSAKSSVEYSIHELKQRNSNNGFFSGIMQGLVGAAAELAGMQYGQDFSGVSDSINSYIQNDSYMNKMNKHLYDVNQFAHSSSNVNGSQGSSGSSAGSSTLRAVGSGNATGFKNTLSSGNYNCDSAESLNMQAYMGEQFKKAADQAENNMCAKSRVMADEMRKLLPYVQRCTPEIVREYEEQISFFDSRSHGSCVN